MRRPWSTWKNSSKKKRKGEVAEKVQRNCKVLLYWMCIKFFRSLTTDIYSLTLPNPSRLRQTLLDCKEKNLLKINYFKYYNQIVKILVESGSSSPSLTLSATLHRPSTRTNKSASSRHIPLAQRTGSTGRFRPCSSFGFFQIGHSPFTKIIFLDTCEKRCQQYHCTIWIPFPFPSRIPPLGSCSGKP